MIERRSVPENKYYVAVRKSELDALEAENAALLKDKELLDFMQSMTVGYGAGWIFRESRTGRGMRLHETSESPAFADVRQAIGAMKERR